MLTVAQKTLEKFVSLMSWLYEQKKTAPDCGAALDDYVRRRWGWANCGETTIALFDPGSDELGLFSVDGPAGYV